MGRSEIDQLKMENNRLYSHHSDCKKEMGDLVDLANKWKARFDVAKDLLFWLNSKHPFWYEGDLKKEIKIQSEALIKKRRRI